MQGVSHPKPLLSASEHTHINRQAGRGAWNGPPARQKRKHLFQHTCHTRQNFRNCGDIGNQQQTDDHHQDEPHDALTHHLQGGVAHPGGYKQVDAQGRG